jgi:Uma2 family endonuclease
MGMVSLEDTTEVVPLTVHQYHRMQETGILAEDEPIELLNGLLVHKDRGGAQMPVSPLHAVVVSRMVALAPDLEARGCHLRLQNPITIEPRHEPEPDGFIVRGRVDDYLDRHPEPREVTCVIEIADSSLRRDRTTKKTIYAEASIPQYVLVNLDRRIEIYERPNASDGTYGSTRVLGKGDVLALSTGAQPLEVQAATFLP